MVLKRFKGVLKLTSIKLTTQQLSNLYSFLTRVELKGNEVPAFVELQNEIVKALKEQEGEKGDK